jgi:hypothetical protein
LDGVIARRLLLLAKSNAAEAANEQDERQKQASSVVSPIDVFLAALIADVDPQE